MASPPALLITPLGNGHIAIDATVGNGHDTVFLAQNVAPNGHVYGFDIQQAALDTSLEKCRQQQLSACVSIFQSSHADMAEKIPRPLHGKINAIMFNLGYLPGGDKQIITQTASTVAALSVASQLLSVNGIMTILAYPGHLGGDVETEAVKQWTEQLPADHFAVRVINSAEASLPAPRLFVINKIDDSLPNLTVA
ncbi:putative rRNA methylase YtqB [Crenothrix polyspora]|uniref:Putative rRNA methylase YtqB n=1 Tax=Crenothrix polyspora TaxID=360316 RepID=A0A1R4H933_9GAMM|nr:class I SAM-dependent methyltransferase [Crenothrix polyspora]SJM92745.1 putative rRNA methylase YtqB [Crenothrix polyspora]